MAAKVTIQDIADALGISRNTVSKAINNTGILADATREKVLKKAQEMGYKQFSYMALTDSGSLVTVRPTPSGPREIALLAYGFIGGSHFASIMLDKFQRELTQQGYSLSIHRILPEELKAGQLPASFNKEKTAGIVCVELFDMEYSRMVCRQGLPTLFIDSPADGFDDPLEADKLYMDNQTGIFCFIKEMERRGKTKIGFVGRYMHCHSFYERYMGYRNAMYTLGLPCPEEYSLVAGKDAAEYPTPDDYLNYLEEGFRNMKEIPEVLICANDFVALDVMRALKRLGLSVPKDVYLCGFDDSPESRAVTPSLTTIHIHTQIMGFAATQLLISRIKEPSLNYRIMHTETDLILRESTEG